MKRQIELFSFRKGRELNYSTSVTATKGEKIAVWVCVLLLLCAVLAALFVFKNTLAFVLSIVGGIILIFGVILFCILRPKHREERIQNTVTSNVKVDEWKGMGLK